MREPSFAAGRGRIGQDIESRRRDVTSWLAIRMVVLAGFISMLGGGCGDQPGVQNAAAYVSEVDAFPLEPMARRFEQAWLAPQWDRIRKSPDALETILAALPPAVQLPMAGPRSNQSHGMTKAALVTQGAATSRQDIEALVSTWRQDNIRVLHTDWHQESIKAVDDHFESVVRCNLHVAQRDLRIQIRGRFAVTWHRDQPQAPSALRWIDGSLVERRGPLAFTRMSTISNSNRNPEMRSFLGGLAVYDMDGDTLPDIALGNANRRFMNRGSFTFEPHALSPAIEALHDSLAVVVFGDFDGDGKVDLVANRKNGELIMIRGDGTGAFPGRPRPLLGEPRFLDKLNCLTAGDIDGDSDLDLFGGQWLSPFERMPSSYWDALDGPPNVLLINDGHGRFVDATGRAGLLAKAGRRTYSASLVDLDRDHDLDLLVVSDFSGPDLYVNDGRGHFTDVTGNLLPPLAQRATFGMSHSITDINLDGSLDLFITGMGSTTARRLERMDGVVRDPMRSPMGYGNRLFLGGDGPGFTTSPFAGAVARTGWSWGSAAFDFDNDADSDLYVVNGHISGDTAHDYCTHFWCSDVRQTQPLETPNAINAYLTRLGNTQNMSWDGFQPNALLVNQGTAGFTEAGFLLDLGFPDDARCLVASDLDLDGFVDLVLTTAGGTSGFVHVDREGLKPSYCHVLKNNGLFGKGRSWTGLKLGTGPSGHPHGARVDVVAMEDGKEVHYSKVIVSGDSFMSQHPAEVHFGLGRASSIDRIGITWAGGKEKLIRNPRINQWITIGKRTGTKK